jgi:RHS repeat-associated protein
MTYDAADNELSSTQFSSMPGDPRSITTAYGYDALNNRTDIYEAYLADVGRHTVNQYDAAGNVVLTTTGLSNTNPKPVTTAYAYDGLNRQTAVLEAVGTSDQRLTIERYNAAGDLLSVTQPGPLNYPTGVTTSYAYDSLHRQIQMIAGYGLGAQQRISYTSYDAANNVIQTIDPMGIVTVNVYTALNQLLQQTTAVGKPDQMQTNIAYDAAGNQISITTGQSTNPLLNKPTTTQTFFDVLNRPTDDFQAWGMPEQVQTHTIFDAAGNQVAVTTGLSANSAYNHPETTVNFFDSLNRQVAVIDPMLHLSVTGYDGFGNVWFQQDPLLNRTTYAYDALRRNVAVQLPPVAGYPNLRITTTIYDAADNAVATMDELRNTTLNAFDSYHNLTATQDPKGAITTYLHDKAGDTVEEKDPDGNRTDYAFNAFGDVTATANPRYKIASSTYDADGRLTSVTDENGRRRVMTYDDYGRLQTETWYAADGVTVVDTRGYTYDAAGNLLTASNSAGTYTMTYDALGRTLTRSDPNGLGLIFGYDAAGNRTSVQDSLGGVLVSLYNGDNLLVSRQFGGTGQTPARVDLTYTFDNQIATITRYKDLAATQKVGYSWLTYDGNGLLIHLQHQNGAGGVLADYAYLYDIDGRLWSETDNGKTTTYAYDADSQLLTDGIRGYAYDANGNRAMTGYQTGSDNRMLSDGTWNYVYDNAGNVIKKTNIFTGETWLYGYDNANQMTAAEHRAGNGTLLMHADYAYDVFGNRLAKSVRTGPFGTPVVTRFAYDDQGNLWADLNVNKNLLTRYVGGDESDQLFARIDSSGVTWMLTDHLGSVRDLMNSSSNIIDHVDYDAYGNTVYEMSPSAGGRFKYAGGELDSETGLYHFGARYYDAVTGRWLREDPKGFAAGDSNLYRYVGNSPTDGTDPSGMQEETPEQLLKKIEEAYKARDNAPSGEDYNGWDTEIQRLGQLYEDAKQGIKRTDLGAIPAARIKAMIKDGLAQEGPNGFVYIADILPTGGIYYMLLQGWRPTDGSEPMTETLTHKQVTDGDFYRLVDYKEVPATEDALPNLERLANFRKEDAVTVRVNDYLQGQKNARELGTLSMIRFGIHMVPLGAGIDALHDGNVLEATVSFAGDALFFAGLLSNGAKAFRLISAAGQLGIGGARAGQGVFALMNGNSDKAAGYFGEATLRFLGATSEMVGLLKDKLPSGTGGSRMLKALEANAADQEAAALRLAEREAGIQAMAMSRQKVIETLAGKEKAILYHLDEHIPETIAKIGRNPETISYWRKELDKRLSEMEKLTGAQNLGAKTATEWKVKIGELRTRVNQVLGEE